MTARLRKKMTTNQLDYVNHLQRFGIKLGLETITTLLEALSNPHQKYPTIHVTGTNGKGSTCAFLSSIFQQAGYTVGLYTSPHLIRFNERIKINGKDIPDKELATLIKKTKAVAEQQHLSPTFFEFTTALAFLYFARKKADIAIVEVGLGGRLDATNVIRPLVSVITNIAIDHQRVLGNGRQQIAREKVGIIKKNSLVITGETNQSLVAILQKTCRQRNALLVEAPQEIKIKEQQEGEHFQEFQTTGSIKGMFSIPLLGRHQLDNARTALLVAWMLKKRFGLEKKHLRQGLKKVSWPGRLQMISREPRMIIDGAHNGAGMTALRDFMRTKKNRKVLVLGIAKDKEIQKMVRIIVPLFKEVIVTQGNFKPAETEVIAREARKYVKNVIEIPDVRQALTAARKRVGKKELLLITGSLYLIGDVLSILQQQPQVKNR